MKECIMINSNMLLEDICTIFNIDRSTEVKRKFGKLPAYTYNDIISRMLKYSDSRTPLTTIFPEMSRPTSSNMLKAAFPQKKDAKQPWISFLLSSIGVKMCCSCAELKSIGDFYHCAGSSSGIRSVCVHCDNSINKIHRDNNKDYYRTKKHEHYENNKAYYRDKKLRRSTELYMATPPWANMGIMNSIYRNTPEGYHVDHIVPIKGTNVCGLHCEHNLQYLLAEDNLAKSNKFCADTYQHTLPIENMVTNFN